MKRFLKIPTEELVKLDFTQNWTVTPTFAALLNEKSIDEVVWSEDGTYGTVSYDTIEQVQAHTYRYISPITGKEETHTVEAGIHGRPLFYDAETMTEVTQAEVDAIVAEYNDYEVGHVYSVNDKFKYNNKTYLVIQQHTSQEDWKPDIVKALYREIVPAELIGEWVQPTGAHDAYQKGDKVLFNGSIYESLIDNNVWSPAVYPAGWKKL